MHLHRFDLNLKEWKKVAEITWPFQTSKKIKFWATKNYVVLFGFIKGLAKMACIDTAGLEKWQPNQKQISPVIITTDYYIEELKEFEEIIGAANETLVDGDEDSFAFVENEKLFKIEASNVLPLLDFEFKSVILMEGCHEEEMVWALNHVYTNGKWERPPLTALEPWMKLYNVSKILQINDLETECENNLKVIIKGRQKICEANEIAKGMKSKHCDNLLDILYPKEHE